MKYLLFITALTLPACGVNSSKQDDIQEKADKNSIELEDTKEQLKIERKWNDAVLQLTLERGSVTSSLDRYVKQYPSEFDKQIVQKFEDDFKLNYDQINSDLTTFLSATSEARRDNAFEDAATLTELLSRINKGIEGITKKVKEMKTNDETQFSQKVVSLNENKNEIETAASSWTARNSTLSSLDSTLEILKHRANDLACLVFPCVGE